MTLADRSIGAGVGSGNAPACADGAPVASAGVEPPAADLPQRAPDAAASGRATADAGARRLPILCLDLGTKTGWALVGARGDISSGVQSFALGRYDGGGMRFLRFKRWLVEMKGGGLEAVYFEEVRRHVGTDAAHVYGGFLGQLTAWCEQHEIPYEGVPVGTIKKSATGKGNADKDAMIAAVRKQGFDPADDNEADAIILAILAKGRHA